MKVLWCVNIVLPEMAKAVGLPSDPYGGWLVGLAAGLSANEGVQLAITAPYGRSKVIKHRIGNIQYYLVPGKEKKMSRNFTQVIEDFRPDIIHIHGTEYPHSYFLARIAGKIPSVISIQGLLTSYEKYYYAGMEFSDVFLKPSLRDIARLDALPLQRGKFKKRAEYERKALRLVKYVIGRTPWDYSNVKAINPSARYFHCEEALRDSFYRFSYDVRTIERHTIFVSQGNYPIKGLHMLLMAAALLKEEYRDLKILISGQNIIGGSRLKRLKITGYGSYITRLIHRLQLEENVVFTGPLNEEKTADHLLRCNAFVLPSAVENSSNSLCEAMLMGVPCICAETGGTPHIVEQGRCGLLYPFMEYPMLAECIRRVFDDDGLAQELSSEAQKVARLRHDRGKIVSEMIKIYRTVQ